MRELQQSLCCLTVIWLTTLFYTVSLQAQELEINDGENILSSSINWNDYDKVTIKPGGTLTIDSDITKSGSMQEFKVEGILIINAGATLTWPGPMTFTEGDSNNSTINGNIIQSNGVFKIDKKNVAGSGGISIEGPSSNFTLDGGGTLFGESDPDDICPSYPCQSGVALPVELIMFRAEKRKEIIILSWITASEINNHYFAVERSINGVNFEEIARLQGKGTKEQATHYQFIDKNHIANNINYYRLRQVDFDGSKDFSEVVSVQGKQDYGSLVVFPNPTKANLNISLPEAVDQEIQIQFYDNQGRPVYSYTQIPQGKTIAITVDGIPKGIYWVQIIGLNKPYQEKVIIQ